MRVLVVGAGIAGLTAALCLRRSGHQVLLIEQAPRLRDEGFMIDFFGPGYEVADRLGLLGALADIHRPVESLSLRDGRGHQRFSVGYSRLRRSLFGDRHFNVMRGELERLLFAAVAGQVTIRFGTSIAAIEQAEPGGNGGNGGVVASLSDRGRASFDLIVGADGQHSRVRELVFAPEEQYSHYLGHHTAAFTVDGEDDGIAAEIGRDLVLVTEPGRLLGLYPVRGGRVACFLLYRSVLDRPVALPEAQRRELSRVYRDLGWIVPRLLERAGRAAAEETLYFDTVKQITMPRWSRGRVVLCGDAAWCVSLLAGQGASLAMAGAYVLARQLARPDLAAALDGYERLLRGEVERRQQAGEKLARWMVPAEPWELTVRDLSLRLSSWAPVAWKVRQLLPAGGTSGGYGSTGSIVTRMSSGTVG